MGGDARDLITRLCSVVRSAYRYCTAKSTSSLGCEAINTCFVKPCVFHSRRLVLSDTSVCNVGPIYDKINTHQESIPTICNTKSSRMLTYVTKVSGYHSMLLLRTQESRREWKYIYIPTLSIKHCVQNKQLQILFPNIRLILVIKTNL